MVCCKGQKLLSDANARLPEGQNKDFKLWQGWLEKFKKRLGLRVLKSYGESGDADVESLRRELPRIKNILKNYEPKNIFNADECGLFYKMAPDKAIEKERLYGRKKMKDRITFLPFANADGTEKLELMIIGRAARPRPFKKKSGAQMGFDYYSNTKAWMTSALFHEWLKRFSIFISKTPGRKGALLLDNCSTHGSAESLPKLSNVEIIFLPPNTTSKVQPLDAGVIDAMNVKYRLMQLERALDLVDENAADIYKVDILTAMSWSNKYGKSYLRH